MSKELTYIISPYAGDIEANVAFAIRCCRMAIQQGHTPIHVELLDFDNLKEESAKALERGEQLLKLAEQAHKHIF